MVPKEFAACHNPLIHSYLQLKCWHQFYFPHQGAFWGLMAGLIVGTLRFILEFSFPAPLCFEGKPDDRPSIIKDFHFLYFALFLFVFTCLVCAAVSIVTQPINNKYVCWSLYFSTVKTCRKIEPDLVSAPILLCSVQMVMRKYD